MSLSPGTRLGSVCGYRQDWPRRMGEVWQACGRPTSNLESVGVSVVG